MSVWITALTVAAIAAGATGLAIDIKNAVDGTMPWERTPEQFGKDFLGVAASAGLAGVGSLAGAGLSAAGGALFGEAAGTTAGATTGAAGGTTAAPAASAAGELGAGLSSNVGTTPALEGAMSTTSFAEAGVPISQPVTETLAAAKSSFGTGGTLERMGSIFGDSFKQGAFGAASGAAQNPRDPVRGAMIGAAGGATSGALGGAFRGSIPVRTAPEMVAPRLYTPAAPGSDMASNFSFGSVPTPSAGDRLGSLGLGLTRNVASRGAGFGVAQATEPPAPLPPPPPNPNFPFPDYPGLYRPRGVGY